QRRVGVLARVCRVGIRAGNEERLDEVRRSGPAPHDELLGGEGDSELRELFARVLRALLAGESGSEEEGADGSLHGATGPRGWGSAWRPPEARRARGALPRRCARAGSPCPRAAPTRRPDCRTGPGTRAACGPAGRRDRWRAR